MELLLQLEATPGDVAARLSIESAKLRAIERVSLDEAAFRGVRASVGLDQTEICVRGRDANVACHRKLSAAAQREGESARSVPTTARASAPDERSDHSVSERATRTGFSSPGIRGEPDLHGGVCCGSLAMIMSV